MDSPSRPSHPTTKHRKSRNDLSDSGELSEPPKSTKQGSSSNLNSTFEDRFFQGEPDSESQRKKRAEMDTFNLGLASSKPSKNAPPKMGSIFQNRPETSKMSLVEHAVWLKQQIEENSRKKDEEKEIERQTTKIVTKIAEEKHKAEVQRLEEEKKRAAKNNQEEILAQIATKQSSPKTHGKSGTTLALGTRETFTAEKAERDRRRNEKLKEAAIQAVRDKKAKADVERQKDLQEAAKFRSQAEEEIKTKELQQKEKLDNVHKENRTLLSSQIEQNTQKKYEEENGIKSGVAYYAVGERLANPLPKDLGRKYYYKSHDYLEKMNESTAGPLSLKTQ
jgi:hypothetical protein